MDSNELRLIPDFSGEGPSVQEWLEKVELVCELRGIKNVEKIIPLRLTGHAFAVYQQLCKKDKDDLDAIKSALIGAFGIDQFTAYDMFVGRHLGAGESVDVYLADLRKLASAFGGASERLLSCAFVAGLPEATKRMLKAGARIETMTLTDILLRARAVTMDEPKEPNVVCAGKTTPRASGPPRPERIDSNRCYECGLPNHLARDCLLRRTAGASNSRPPRRNFRCFRCGGRGHVASACQGNDEGEKANAPVSSPTVQE